MLRTLLLASLLATLLLAPRSGAEPAAAPSERRVTLTFHDVPLRAALQQLFEGSGLNYAVDPGVPNVAITLALRDTSVESGLRRIIDGLSKQTPCIVAIREAGLYLLEPRSLFEASSPPLRIAAQAISPRGRLSPRPTAPRPAGGPAPAAVLGAAAGLTILGVPGDNSLVVHGTPERIAEFRRVLNLLDLPGRQLRVRISTGHLGAEGLVLASGLLRLSDASSAGKLDVAAVPRLNGDGSVDLVLRGTITTGGAAHPVQSHVRLTAGRAEEIAALGQGGRRVRLWARVSVEEDDAPEQPPAGTAAGNGLNHKGTKTYRTRSELKR